MARILIADDDENYIRAFRDGMEALGHEVVSVPNGDAVMPELARGGLDVIFLDVVMAGGGAISVLHKIRDVDADVPVVVITGRPELIDSPLFAKGLRQAQAKLPKTTPLKQLNDLVEDVLAH